MTDDQLSKLQGDYPGMRLGTVWASAGRRRRRFWARRLADGALLTSWSVEALRERIEVEPLWIVNRYWADPAATPAQVARTITTALDAVSALFPASDDARTISTRNHRDLGSGQPGATCWPTSDGAPSASGTRRRRSRDVLPPAPGLTLPWVLAQVELAVLQRCGERLPLLGSECQHRPAPVLGVTNSDKP